jgi:hypothetical protein
MLRPACLPQLLQLTSCMEQMRVSGQPSTSSWPLYASRPSARPPDRNRQVWASRACKEGRRKAIPNDRVFWRISRLTNPLEQDAAQAEPRRASTLHRAVMDRAPAQEQSYEAVPARGVASTSVLSAAALGFALVSLDVFSPASLHLLQAVDWAAHEWTNANLPSEAIPSRMLLPLRLPLTSLVLLTCECGAAFQLWPKLANTCGPTTYKVPAVHACVTEKSRVHLVLLGMQKRTVGPYLGAMLGILLPVLSGSQKVAGHSHPPAHACEHGLSSSITCIVLHMPANRCA